ncbi:hypothetical protein WN944_017958 [Citrus x changshan-huyou]|uniref:Signal peptidase complex subunit 2 n=1 Tax=Citrus x changshan-huyou TaxID=2935761 RepID=A0AAP0LSU0_9ROSI
MQEKKSSSTSTEMANKNPKKANLLDHHSIKHILDESVSEIVTSRGYVEDVRMSNVRLLLGTIIIAIALVAQFYKKKFPENRDFLIGCIALYPFYFLSLILDSGKYIVFNGILQLIIHTKEKNAILFTYPPEVSSSFQMFAVLGPASLVCIFGILLVHANCVSVLHKVQGSFTSTGLVVSSKLPRFSDLYTLTVASADPKSISAGQPVEFTKSVTQWFAKDGVLVEGLFWKDVFALLDEYAIEPKKKK